MYARGLPVYYFFDWDYDGLFIIYPLVKQKIPTIKLLTPGGISKGIEETEHNNSWGNVKHQKNINALFNSKQIEILDELIKNDQWIKEESNNLIDII